MWETKTSYNKKKLYFKFSENIIQFLRKRLPGNKTNFWIDHIQLPDQASWISQVQLAIGRVGSAHPTRLMASNSSYSPSGHLDLP